MNPARRHLTLIAITALLVAGCATGTTPSAAPSPTAPAAVSSTPPTSSAAMLGWALLIKDPITAWAKDLTAAGTAGLNGDVNGLVVACQHELTDLATIRVVPASPDPAIAAELTQAVAAGTAAANACTSADFAGANTYQAEANKHLVAANALINKAIR